MTAASVCRVCGTETLKSARFCHGCGSPVAAGPAHAEFKQVTVLFADVVGSMEIAAATGAERLREIMAALVDRVTGVVQRYGGTVDMFTGDGVMAVFGAPVALEDHAVRGCLASLDIQREMGRLSAEIESRDGVALQLRIGLNSGQVISGDIGVGAKRQTAIGEQVAIARGMESVAPAGGVMLSESTARLVATQAVLGEPKTMHVKGAAEPVRARRLLDMAQREWTDVSESTLVGREWEMATLSAILERSVEGRGSVVAVAGPPGIGKTRLAGEVAQLATRSGIDVFSAFCEAHSSDVPFRVVARLLRAVARVSGLDNRTARERVRERFPDADPQDLLLLHDLLGIADPTVVLPKIDADARRRRLTALINTAHLARTRPALFIVEDLHWIDQASESMLAGFVPVTVQTRSMVLFTYRPEYHGALRYVPGGHTIALAPLAESETCALVAGLLGPDASVAAIGPIVSARAGGNPYFAQEIIRELAERGVLVGHRGGYACRAAVGEVRAPATLQAAIASRIDRLSPDAKRTLGAAAVIGSRFRSDLLTSLGTDPRVEELMAAELIDQVRFTTPFEYAFHHPLIRAVAYESQLKSDRAELHRRLASAIEARGAQPADQNAALIAEHLEAAGDVHAAYGWHMRAASWATNRDIAAAQLSWQRAQGIADALPEDDPHRAAMRIAARTMLCGIAWRLQADVAGELFDELRSLCASAGDKGSLAIGMTGVVMDHAFQARMDQASLLASEAMELIESIGDPTLTVGLSTATVYAKIEYAAWVDALRWSQRIIELSGGDPSMGNFIFGSPLAIALTTRALAGYCLGRAGWQDGLRQGLAMARGADSTSYAIVVTYVYLAGVAFGVLRPDDEAVAEITAAVHRAEESGDDMALGLVQVTLGVALVHRDAAADREGGQRMLADVSETLVRRGQSLGELPLVDAYAAREIARHGDLDRAIPLMRAALERLYPGGRLLPWGVPATSVLVEALLERGTDDDVAEAGAALDRLSPPPASDFTVRDIVLLRLRALLARSRGDAAAYAHFRDRYCDMAETLGFEGHLAWAEAMPQWCS